MRIVALVYIMIVTTFVAVSPDARVRPFEARGLGRFPRRLAAAWVDSSQKSQFTANSTVYTLDRLGDLPTVTEEEEEDEFDAAPLVLCSILDVHLSCFEPIKLQELISNPMKTTCRLRC